MVPEIKEYLQKNREICFTLLRQLIGLGKPFLLRSEIWDVLLR